ncbi:hypothetical protein XENOCAPTIV_016258, partial [Xenoophorus captivus]
SSEMEALRAQLARLQAEKNDLVALNSELQLKAEQGSQDDSFIEIIKVSVRTLMNPVLVRQVQRNRHQERVRRPDLSMTSSRLENEEMTVSQLLQSLRNETQRCERLQAELLASAARIRELEEKNREVERTTQKEAKEDAAKEEQAASEVENLKSQMMTLFKDLQQAQSKLDEAEGMKKNLQDRLAQQIPTENYLAQLKDAYTKLFEDYNELKEEKIRKQSHMVERTLMEDLQQRLTAAEEALVVKQNKIDDMKQEIFQKEKELETISVFQAQAEVYSSDFYAERAAREKLHEEKERLAAQLEYIKKQNTQLQQDMDSLGRYEVTQRTGTEWNQENIPEHACPKCSEILPDLDSLQIHIMDCIN